MTDIKIILTEEESIKTALATVGIDSIKNELQKTVDFSKKLTITDLEDKTQFKIVKDTKNGYVKTRNTIKRAFKFKRDDYNKLAKDNLQAEREVIAVIEIEENRLNDLVEKAELEKLKKDNALKLEDRKTELNKYDFKETDDNLLIMSDKEFNILLLSKKDLHLAKKEAELKIEQERITREKELEEAKKQAKLEAEKEAERKAEVEKQRVENEKIQAENKRLADIEKAKEETKEEMKVEIEEKVEKEVKKRVSSGRINTIKNEVKIDKKQEYNKYEASIEFDYYRDEEGKRTFYKKVGEFKF